MKQRLLPPVALLSLAVLSVLGWRLSRPPVPEPEWVGVRMENTSEELWEVGLLEGRSKARVMSPVRGTVAQVPEDGILVTEGQLLFRIDDEALRNDIEGVENNLDLKQEELDTAKGELSVITNSYAAARRLELAELDHAKLELAYREQGLLPDARRKLEIAIELASLDLQAKQDERQRAAELVKRKFAAPSSLDKLERETAAASAFLEERKTRMELETQPLLEEERLTLQAAVDQDKDVVERSMHRHEREVARQQLKIDGIELEISHLEERRQELEEQRSMVTIEAPADGVLRIIRRMDWSSGTWIPLNVGQESHGLDMLGEIIDPDDLLIRLMIHESDIENITTGMPVRVRVDAYPGEVLTGRVETVTSLGQDRTDLSPLTRQVPPSYQAQFLAMLSFDQDGLDLRPGMTARVALQLQAARERLLIPRNTLSGNTDQPTVTVLRDGQPVPIQVQGQYRRDGWFEVNRGLSADEKVLVVKGGSS